MRGNRLLDMKISTTEDTEDAEEHPSFVGLNLRILSGVSPKIIVASGSYPARSQKH